MIPIGFYRPDLAETNPGVTTSVLNAILQQDANGVAYGPQAGAAILATSTALPEDPRGVFSFVSSDGTYKVIAGTETSLYLMNNSGVWSSLGGGQNLPAGHNWSATQFGKYAVFSNTADGMIQYDLDLGGGLAAITAAPKARFIFNLFGTLAALDCDGENRVMRTSRINDHTLWSGPGANFQEFEDGQELLAGGEIGPGVAVVFQRDHIRLLTRRSDKYVFSAEHLADGVGASSPEAVVFTYGAAYTCDTFGFHKVTAAGPMPISEGKITRTFNSRLSSNGLNTIQGVYDPEFGRVMWRYQADGVSSAKVTEDVFTYHIAIGEWVPLKLNTTMLVAVKSPGYTLEDLDTINASVDALPYSLDSSFYKGGIPRLAVLNEDNLFGYLTGDNLACTLQTGVLSSPTSVLVRSIVPDSDNPDATVQTGVKDQISDSLTWSTAAGIEASGRSMQRARGKHIAFRFNAAAGDNWTFMRGFRDEDFAQGGVR